MDNFIVELYEFEVESDIRYGLVYDPINDVMGREKRCGCGCGAPIKECNKRLHGHSWVGRKHTEVELKKIGDGNRGKILSEETKMKLRVGHLGLKQAEETIRKRVEKLKGKPQSEESNKKRSKAMMGHKVSEKVRKIFANSMKGKTPWNKGIPHTIEAKINMSKSHKGQLAWNRGKKGCFSKETIEVMCRKSKANWDNPEYIEKWKRGMSLRPNYAEECLDDIQKFNILGYRYTGDGEFWIGRKNPDFIHNTEKKIIEFFGEHFHPPEDEPKLINYYKEHGYECVVIWYKELFDEEKLSRKLGIKIKLPPKEPKKNLKIEVINLKIDEVS